MSPLTWDQHTPLPVGIDPMPDSIGTEQTPKFDDGDFEGESTMIVSAAYELKPRFTGRNAAIARLHQLTDKAFDDRELGFAIVVGEPGMGKSRMLSEVTARIRTMHPNALVLVGAADDSDLAYGPIVRAIAHRYSVVLGEDPQVVREKLIDGISEIMPAARVTETAHLLAHALRVPFEDSPVVAPLLESPQRLEARFFMALKRLLQAEAEKHPVLIVVENLEIAGPETLNLIAYLAAGLNDQRVALVATATPAFSPRQPAFRGDVQPIRIELGALTADDGEALLRELCKQLDAVPPKLVDHVRTMTGSPRAIYELVRLLLESDCIVREGQAGYGSWKISAPALAAMQLPKTYEDLVAARLRVMDPTERRVLEMAAVIGETSWLDAVLALERGEALRAMGTTDPDGPTLSQIAASGDKSRQSVLDAVTKLVEREWLVDAPSSSISGERELKFTYPNLWTIVEKGIDDNHRRTYHATVARWLELHPEGRGAATQEEVARHMALGGDVHAAAIRYRRAAEAARAQYANERAIRLFDRALTCLGDHDLAARIHIWHDLGSVYELIGDFEAALGAFERMLRLSWVAASKTKAAVAFNKMGRVWRRKGDLKLAVEYLERGLELFRGAGDGRGIASSLDDIGKSLQMLGRYDEAHAKITEALTRRGKSGDKRAIATSLSRLGDVQQDRGQYESAYNCHKEALELRQAAGDRWGQIVSQNNLAALAFELGQVADARTGWTEALAAAESIGALPVMALVLTNLGELAVFENRLEEAKGRLEAAMEIIEDIEDRGLESEACRHMAALEKLHGRTPEARTLAERALAVAKKAGLREKEAQAYLTLGDVLANNLYDSEESGGAISPAELAYDRAIEVLRTIGNEAALGKALFAFGRYKAEVGDVADGKNMLRDAIAVFSKLGLDRPVAEAQKLIASLA